MSRVRVQTFEEDGATGDVFVRDTASANGGAWAAASSGSAGATIVTKTYATVTTGIAANVDAGGVGGGANLDNQLPDLSVGSFLDDVEVYRSGRLMRGGASSGANNDYYPGTSLGDGQLKFEDALVAGEVLCVVTRRTAGSLASPTKTFANVTIDIPANTNVGGVAGGVNLDAQLPDLSLGAFLDDYDVFLSGRLMRPGASSSSNNDYYPGTSLANGQLKFETDIAAGEVITVVARA